MAKETSVNLRNWQFYQIFIRQFSPTHDFKGAIENCLMSSPWVPIAFNSFRFIRLESFVVKALSEALIPSGIIMRLTR